MTPIPAETLRDMAALLPTFSDPDFRFVDDTALKASGISGFGTFQFAYTEPVWRLVDVVSPTVMEYSRLHRETFSWPDWSETPEAQRFMTQPDALVQATPEQLVKLLTIFVRQERFSDGAMRDFWESGVLLGILRRAAQLVTATQGTQP